jgi:putative ABC transport system substrate-binding protein
MRRRDFMTAAGILAFLGRGAAAQSARRRIAYIAPGVSGNPLTARSQAAFMARLAQLAWVPDQIDFTAYYAGADANGFSAAARQALVLKPDVIVAVSGSTLAALKDEKTIPIVFNQVTDPVSQGFVTSLAHPGGNITGFSYFDASLASKWLSLLKEIVPRLSRAICLFNPDTAASASFYLRVLSDAGAAVGMTIEAGPIHSSDDIVRVVKSAAAKEAAVIELPDGFFTSRTPVLVGETLRNRVPGFYFLTSQVPQGGLVTYAVDEIQQAIDAAGYVDRILRGEKPGDLPVQSPTKFVLAINLKTAKALGLTIPETLLVQADEVIE